MTREPELLSIEDTQLPINGSIYIDAQSLKSDIDTTLLSAANASDDKLTLAIREPASLYDSKALVYEVDGAFKPTLPFPVPSNVRERNLITYGANNYHYRSDSSRLTPSSSSKVPTNMTRLGIGHDVTDPTKAITGYIATLYLWPGEITPTVAEALVRGDLDPKDADTGAFTPEAGALAFVFNTQGTATDGDKVVELPVSGSTNNILVDWGDNTSSSFIGAAANSTVSHTYSAPGIYPVQITADDDGTNSGLENLNFFNSSQRLDLVRVLQWGGSTTWQPTTMYRVFRDCTQLDFENAARTNLPDTSAITDWREAFYNCQSISGAYPNFDHSAATNLSSTWHNCSSITTFGSSLNDLAVATNYIDAWRGCSSITSFPSITIPTNQGSVNLTRAWFGCTNLQSFPSDIDTGAVTNLSNAWEGCSSLDGTFPTLDTSSVTSCDSAWKGCSSLDSFPNLDLSQTTSAGSAWDGCSSLSSFQTTNFEKATNLSIAWRNCSSLTSFPNINIPEATNLSFAWYGCSNLSSFSTINFPKATSLNAAFYGWTSFTGTFSQITTSSALLNLESAWQNNKMTVFNPPTVTSEVTNMRSAWNGCTGLTGTFPSINTSSATNISSAWYNCSGITSFPDFDFSNVEQAGYAGGGTDGAFAGTAITTFPNVTFPELQYAEGLCRNCTNLTTFPAGVFDTWNPSTVSSKCFYGAWQNCTSLTPASVENILDSIALSGQNAPSGTGTNDRRIDITYNTSTGHPYGASLVSGVLDPVPASITTLKGRSPAWRVFLNGVEQ